MYPPVVCTTPLGCPVEPEVYKMNKMSSEATAVAGQFESTLATSSCHHLSLPSFQVTSASVLFTTITDSTTGEVSHAWSTTAFTGIFFFPL